jgi:hypothetical protein
MHVNRPLRALLTLFTQLALPATALAQITTLPPQSATVIATGTSQARKFADRFADSINVRDFGADPTGATDSAPAFNAAIASVASGATVRLFVPRGSYLLSSASVVSNGRYVIVQLDSGARVGSNASSYLYGWANGGYSNYNLYVDQVIYEVAGTSHRDTMVNRLSSGTQVNTVANNSGTGMGILPTTYTNYNVFSNAANNGDTFISYIGNWLRSYDNTPFWLHWDVVNSPRIDQQASGYRASGTGLMAEYDLNNYSWNQGFGDSIGAQGSSGLSGLTAGAGDGHVGFAWAASAAGVPNQRWWTYPAVFGAANPGGTTLSTDRMTINGTSVTMPSGGTPTAVAAAINAAGIANIGAAVSYGRLVVYSTVTHNNGTLTLANGNGTPLQTMGLSAGTTTAYKQAYTYAAASGMSPIGAGWSFTINGTSVTFPTGATTLAQVQARIAAAAPASVTATISGPGVLILSSPASVPMTLADTSGTPLEALYLSPGTVYPSGAPLAQAQVYSDQAPPLVPATSQISINGTTVALSAGTGTLANVATAINNAAIPGVTAHVYQSSSATGQNLNITNTTPGGSLVLADVTGTPLETLGIVPGTYTADSNYPQNYVGFLVNVDSVAPNGRGFLADGQTGTRENDNQHLPNTPLDIRYGWMHGIRTDKATFRDNNALLLGAGQAIGWANGDGSTTPVSLSSGTLQVGSTALATQAWVGSQGYIPTANIPAGTAGQAVLASGTAGLLTTGTLAASNVSGLNAVATTGTLSGGTLAGGTLAGGITNSGTITGGIVNPATLEANGSRISLAGALTTSGAYPLTLTQTGSTSVTLPTAGTLDTTAARAAAIGTALPGATSSQAYVGTGTAGLAGTLTLGGLATLAVPPAGVVTSTGSALAAATVGSGLSTSGGTLANTGVVSLGGLTGTVSCGTNVTCAAGTISAAGYTLPAATAAVLGGVRPDGITIANTAGAISVGTIPVASVTGALSATTAAATYAPLASPTFTGTPVVPGYVPTANIPAASGQLLGGSGTAGTAGVVTVGTGLSLSGGTLTANGAGYTLPAATASVLGGVMPDGITIANTGGAISVGTVPVASVTGALSAANIPAASGQLLGGSGTAGTAGVVTVGSGLSLSGGTLTASGAGYTLPAATSTTLGGVRPDGITIANTAGAISVGTIPVASVTGALSASNIPAASGQLLGGSGTAGTAGAVSVGNGLSLSGGTLASPTNYQSFTTPGGTWTKPTGATFCTAYLVAGGGSGGAGGTVASSGSGGGGGGGAERIIGPVAASLLPSSATVTVGAGGASPASGANGSAGGNTSIAWGLTTMQQTAYGSGGGGTGVSGAASGGGGSGGAGGAGGSASGATAGSAGTYYGVTGGSGAAGTVGQNAGPVLISSSGPGGGATGAANSTAGQGYFAASPGGSGGGLTSGVAVAGAVGTPNANAGSTAGGAATGAAGVAGTSNTAFPAGPGGTGGGGGGGNASGVGGAGGAGGFPGGGGGGGGSGTAGGGAGGAGGNGEAVVVCQ